MRRIKTLVLVGALGASAVVAFDERPVDAASGPQVFSIVVGRDVTAAKPTIIIVGVGLTKAKSFQLRSKDGAAVGAPTPVVRTANMIALLPPEGLTDAKYELLLGFGKSNTLSFDVAISAGPVAPGTLNKDAFSASTLQDIDDASTLGGFAASDFALASNALTKSGGSVTGNLNVAAATIGGSTLSVASTAASGAGVGVLATTASPSGVGVFGVSTSQSPTGAGIGVHGQTSSVGGVGVLGDSQYAGSGASTGVEGATPASSGTGVYGVASSPTGGTLGVVGRVYSPDGIGVYGFMSATTGTGAGVYGSTASSSGSGLFGIATSTAGAAVGVYGLSGSSAGFGVVGRATANGGIGVEAVADAGGRALYALQSGTGSGSAAIHANHTGGSGDIAVFQSASSNVARIDKSGVGYFNGGTTTGGADFAESVAVNRPKAAFEPGDVIVIDETGKRRFALSSTAESTLVAGIYATKPGVLARPGDVAGAAGDWRATEVPMAITGIVPCKVCDEGGPVKTGDLLVSASIAGYAKKASASPAAGTILGKALEPLTGARGKVEVLITLR
jgi:hypothetical protein